VCDERAPHTRTKSSNGRRRLGNAPSLPVERSLSPSAHSGDRHIAPPSRPPAPFRPVRIFLNTDRHHRRRRAPKPTYMGTRLANNEKTNGNYPLPTTIIYRFPSVWRNRRNRIRSSRWRRRLQTLAKLRGRRAKNRLRRVPTVPTRYDSQLRAYIVCLVSRFSPNVLSEFPGLPKFGSVRPRRISKTRPGF